MATVLVRDRAPSRAMPVARLCALRPENIYYYAGIKSVGSSEQSQYVQSFFLIMICALCTQILYIHDGMGVEKRAGLCLCTCLLCRRGSSFGVALVLAAIRCKCTQWCRQQPL